MQRWCSAAALLLLCSLGGMPVLAAENELDIYHNEIRLGDLDQLEQAHVIRFLVPFSKTFYFLDQAHQRGLSYEMIKLFEEEVNDHRQKGHIRIKAVVIPTPRDRLLTDLAQGYGDVAAGNLTITPERLHKVDFSEPFYDDAREVVVSTAAVSGLKSLFELSAREVYVRKSSSYHESLLRLNKTLQATAKKPVRIRAADPYLEDEDLLEMVSAGLIPMVVVDLHKARVWAEVFPGLVVHDGLVLRRGGRIGWAIRQGSPLLKEEVNRFVRGHRQGSLHFNMLARRYLKDRRYLSNNTSQEQLEKFKTVIALLRKYGRKYAFDWIMIGALAYQESGLDQSKKSRAGAVGIMQVLPSTAADPNVGIKDIHILEQNVHAGTKYLRFMVDRYYAGEQMDPVNRHLFAFASYNAGPARVARLRKEAAEGGLDPNVWFNNVELIAAKRIGRETVQYVSNIYKYYIAYRLIVKTLEQKNRSKQQAAP
ncbi:MltF family protein [Desulfogranum mediterraneum]|uniref:transglycosylase SLT domain-containing protein n=1 Tax=Desulfogranum mediterraneum TaxID=160661 RepID=UPI00040D449F|nr:lytic transglycosylase F [Desulfogranum mediterraneum]